MSFLEQFPFERLVIKPAILSSRINLSLLNCYFNLYRRMCTICIMYCRLNQKEQNVHCRRIHSGDQNDIWNANVFDFESAGESRRPFCKLKSPLTYS